MTTVSGNMAGSPTNMANMLTAPMTNHPGLDPKKIGKDPKDTANDKIVGEIDSNGQNTKKPKIIEMIDKKLEAIHG